MKIFFVNSLLVNYISQGGISLIMDYGNLRLIGTSHIAKQSLKDVKKAFEEFEPEIVAIELDKRRLMALMSKKKVRGPGIKDIRKVGIKGFIFSIIGAWVENKLGKLVGVAPGSEMMAAVRLAKKKKIVLALVDQDIEITLRRFSQELTWKEKWNFIVDIFRALVLRQKQDLGFDLTKVPTKAIIDKLIAKVRVRYPSVYNVLIKERNEVMAKNLSFLMGKNPDKKILGIIGAGHEEEMIGLIEQMDSQNIYTVTFETE